VPDCCYSAGAFQALLVTGGRWLDRTGQGAWTQVQQGDWLPLLEAEADAGTTMLSVCTGAMLLAHAGVIGTRRAATHASARQDLAGTGAEVVDERVVDVGSLITCGGVTSGLDLALHLVEREFGSSWRNRFVAVLNIERRCLSAELGFGRYGLLVVAGVLLRRTGGAGRALESACTAASKAALGSPTATPSTTSTTSQSSTPTKSPSSSESP